MLKRKLGRFPLVRAGAIGALGAGAVVGAIQCAPDKDAGPPVDVVTNCDLNKLNANDPAEATVKVYAQGAVDLKDRVDKLKDRFKQICNAINADLGAPPGEDVHAACNKIADRVIAANNAAPTPAGSAKPVWVTVKFDITCSLDGKAVAQCTDQCATKKGCDPVATCPKGQASGKCTGKCGECDVPSPNGQAADCKGACTGECALAPGVKAGACQGECIGTCKAPTWQGSCSTGCSTNFRGTCNGTCTGSCDGIAYDGGPGDPDADAGPPPGSGNCTGICTGKCVGEASGSCGTTPPNPPAPCMGDFKGGLCPGNLPTGEPLCQGKCIGVGVACTTTCNGTCSFGTDTCTGTCSACEGTLADAVCTSVPNCNDVNPICLGTCALEGAIKTTCPPTAVDIRVAGDYKLADALAAHAADFSAAAREATLISSNLGGVLQRTLAEFHAIGVVHDNARFCAQQTPATYEDLRKAVNEVIGATLVVQGQKF